ncbi:MAG: heat-inducible transcriptional repressor HrcA [Clostridia bacterium]
MDLSLRQQKILKYIIQNYLELGEPVGSKVIAELVGVSSATVRNEMAELTENGYLEQPHTSAGRIPSGLGFRTHIKSSESHYDISLEEKVYFDTILSNSDPEYILEKAADALSGNYTCAVSTQGDFDSVIKAIQFVQISRSSAMVILLSSSGTVKTRIFSTSFDLNQDILRIFFRVFNQEMMGLKVGYISSEFLKNLAMSYGDLSALISSPLLAVYECAKETARANVIIKGQTKLYIENSLSKSSTVAISDFLQSPEKFKSIFMSFPKQICVIPAGDRLFPSLKDTGIVSSKYYINGNEAGVFVLVGPARMDYPKIIAQMKYVSDYVGNKLTKFIKEEL